MTDKEIRALIEKRRKDWRYGNSVEAKYKAEECDDILELIDSLHEEPKFKVGDIIKHKHYEHWETEEVIEVTAQGVRTNIGWLSFPDEWELVEEPKKKEPVSEELEEAANEWNTKASFTPFYMTLNGKGKPTGVRRNYTTHAESFKAGAKWQKEKMMKDAVNATVHIDSGNYPYIPQIELYDYDKDVPLAKEGDKYKVILIKGNDYERETTIKTARDYQGCKVCKVTCCKGEY